MAKVTETIRIAASPKQIWEMIGDFHGLDNWHPYVVKSEEIEDRGVICRRLTLQDGGVVVESMDDHDDEHMSSRYTMIDVGPLPFAEYEATITVKEAGEMSSTIEWVGTFESKGVTIEEAAQIVSQIYRGGFDSIAEQFGKVE